MPKSSQSMDHNHNHVHRMCTLGKAAVVAVSTILPYAYHVYMDHMHSMQYYYLILRFHFKMWFLLTLNYKPYVKINNQHLKCNDTTLDHGSLDSIQASTWSISSGYYVC